MKKIIEELIAIYQNILLYIMCLCGRRLFNGVDLYSSKKDKVEGVTFSNNKKYLKYIAKFEEKK